MNSLNKSIVEKLLSDGRFVDWVSGRDLNESEHWESWPDRNPEYIREFEEAVQMIKMFRFKKPVVSDIEISYLWQKTKNRIEQKESVPAYKKVLLWYARIASVLLIPFIVALVLFMLSGRYDVFWGNDKKVAATQINNTLLTVKAPVGGRLNFTLPDGSCVWLNSGSELKYPVTFNNSVREVSMTGEAVFEVAKSKHPFIVHNPGPDIKVYGTVFCINSYKDEKDVTVALVEGKISLGNSTTEVFLKPGEVSFFNKKNKKIRVKKSKNITRYLSWRDGRFIFRDTPLYEIAKTLQHNFGVSIEIKNPEIANYRYNAIFENETLEHILYMLTLSAPIKYNYIKPGCSSDGTITKAMVKIYEDRNKVINR
jgi:ferric-dicitrate binding protein FerR (iron transport regulator)